MALLDVSSVLIDPDFTDTIIVRRRKLVIDEHGRPTAGSSIEQDFTNVLAVVTSDSPNNLQRSDDYGSFMRSISVVTQFRLRGQTKDYLPDIVVWRGNNFIVDSFDPYPQFGSGFIQATCQSMDRNDNALDQIINASLKFNSSSNSSLIVSVI